MSFGPIMLFAVESVRPDSIFTFATGTAQWVHSLFSGRDRRTWRITHVGLYKESCVIEALPGGVTSKCQSNVIERYVDRPVRLWLVPSAVPINNRTWRDAFRYVGCTEYDAFGAMQSGLDWFDWLLPFMRGKLHHGRIFCSALVAKCLGWKEPAEQTPADVAKNRLWDWDRAECIFDGTKRPTSTPIAMLTLHK